MAKKRNCRRTDEESRIHDLAVKLRKMTDSQLVEYISACSDAARKEGFQAGRAEAVKAEKPAKTALDFITFLKAEKVPGIGVVKLNNLLEVARKNGFIEGTAG